MAVSGLSLHSPLTQIKGIGEQQAAKFQKLGLSKIGQLIDYYPKRYDDYSSVSPISKLKPGQVTIKAVIKQATGRYVRRGLHITEAVASDETASVRLVWFNQPYRAQSLKKGQEYYISGKYELSNRRFAIMNPAVELVSDFPVNTARIIPIYKETKGLNSRQIRLALAKTSNLISGLPESLPQWLVKQQALASYSQALYKLHFPNSSDDLRVARERLGFEEVFGLSLASLMTRRELIEEKAPSVPFNLDVAKRIIDVLPYKLTDGQRAILWQIYQDMEKTTPMNRLVEGDVGSGKTLLAALAAIMVINSGHQVALMAPTELLARQHATSLNKLLGGTGFEDKIGLLVGSLGKKQKDNIQHRIKTGDCRFIVGTQALIQDKVDAKELELVIIDEQHRFGVKQRQKLQSKAGHMPHLLSLTATPIPRSLALVLYGEMDVSILAEKPHGRQPVSTEICSPNSRAQLYSRVEKQLKQGDQVFVVCPTITESDMMPDISVESMYKRVSQHFKHYRVGLLHGKLKADEKAEIMQKFLDHELDILVSTTVIEVGVDVPNASVMVIEGADRFGLAQIHQLRGRIGRGSKPGHCFLVTTDSSEPSKRLRAIERSNDGFKLAELDLKLRGPGAIYGTLQHGQLDLRIAKLDDVKQISAARNAAQEFIDKGESLDKYPGLKQKIIRLQAITNLN